MAGLFASKRRCALREIADMRDFAAAAPLTAQAKPAPFKAGACWLSAHPLKRYGLEIHMVLNASQRDSQKFTGLTNLMT